MDKSEKSPLYELLRAALNPSAPKSLSSNLTNAEWLQIHSECLKQLTTGIVYKAICDLPKEQRPPFDIILQWASEAETIKGHNKLLNDEAARLTELFAAQGHKTAVLKGPANARLYPDTYIRQAGDIDLWVDGGKESVLSLLKQMGYEIDDMNLISQHHVHLHPTTNNILVEIHYRSSSGNLNLFTSKRLLRFLESEIQNVEKVPEGFCVPSIKFALAMQLSHIQRHFFTGGIGFKQLIDYYILLQHASENDRSEIHARLSRFGLLKTCSALMWLMQHVFGLESEKMLCKPDEKRGKKMLAKVCDGGNFGKHRQAEIHDTYKKYVRRFLRKRREALRLFWFDPVEVLGGELVYWKTFIHSIPLRIKTRKLSLWDMYHKQDLKKEADL